MEEVLAHSPADETELVWLEVNHGSGRRQRKRIDVQLRPTRTILVRVLDLGRVGSYRMGADSVGQIADGVRNAMAQSRIREPLSGLHHLPADPTDVAVSETQLFDPEIANADTKKMRDWLQRLPAKQETVKLRWSHARVLVFNSRGIRRKAETTAIGLEIKTGRRPGAGRAIDAGRRLRSLDAHRVLDRARQRHATGNVADLPAEPVPFVLSAAATIELLDLLNVTSFSAKSYYDGTSFLREHLNIQVFDRLLNLKDDGTDQTGLPFPFDLEGTAKHPVDLILKGAPKTPTLDQRQAAVLGLPPTANAIGGNNAKAENLLLMPGEMADSELLSAADDGIWIGALDNVECLEPRRVGFRATARGVRLIQNGKLGSPLEDFFWQDSLLRAFSSLIGLGTRVTRRLGDDGYLGGLCAPPLALNGVAPLPRDVQ